MLFPETSVILIFCFNWWRDGKYSRSSLFTDSVFVSSPLATVYLWPQINTHCAFMHICGYVQSNKTIWVRGDASYQLTSNQLMPCLLLLGCKQVSFLQSLRAMTFTFLCFFLVILMFKMVPKQVVLKCYLVLLSARKLSSSVLSQVLDKLPLAMSHSVVGCEFVIESQYILNKVSNRNTHKTSLCMNCLLKILWS